MKMHPVVIKSRDGLDLVSYLTLPAGTRPDGDGRPDEAAADGAERPRRPVGPRRLGLRPEHQLLANRGYAVLTVNFRGSTGFGKKFLNAGNREWAGKMHDDLLDAVELGRRSRRSPTRRRSPSWAAATAATRRSSA